VLPRLQTQLAELHAVVADADPELEPAERVAEIWETSARIETLAAALKGLHAPRVEDSQVWKQQGFASAADYMAHKSGSTTGRAKSDLGTAKKMRKQPKVTKALKDGDLSPTQADAIADAVEADPSARIG